MLTIGQAFEGRCRGILGKDGFDSRDAPHRGWDFEFQGPKDTWWRVEAKLDIAAERTGNLYFETSFRGARSGIDKTEAHYWMTGIGARGPVMMFRVQPLRQFLADCILAGTAIHSRGGGDDGSSNGILIPIRLIERCPHCREF